jgi:hypothetical protein
VRVAKGIIRLGMGEAQGGELKTHSRWPADAIGDALVGRSVVTRDPTPILGAKAGTQIAHCVSDYESDSENANCQYQGGESG